MASASVATESDGYAHTRLRAQALRNFCFSLGLQRHTYYLLRAVSVFYFTSLLGNPNAGRTAHGWFFAALALAPVVCGAFVKTLPAQRRAIYCGESLLLLAFVTAVLKISPWATGALLIGGIGCFNISFKTVFNASMRRFDDNIDVHFTKLYLAINAGSFLAPVLIGYVFRYDTSAERLAPPSLWMFAWCGVCMALSLYFWWLADQGHQTVPLRDIPDDRSSVQTSVAGVLIVTLFSALFWLGFELRSGKLNQDASNSNMMIQIPWLPAVQLQAVDPLVVTLLAAVFAWCWKALAEKRKDPHPIVKMASGLACIGIGFGVLTFGLSRSSGAISAAWFVWLYVWHSIGELFFEPIGQGFVIANVPNRSKALFLALWEGTGFLAFAGGAQMSNVFVHRRYTLYLVLGVASVCAAAALLALTPALKKMARGA